MFIQAAGEEDIGVLIMIHTMELAPMDHTMVLLIHPMEDMVAMGVAMVVSLFVCPCFVRVSVCAMCVCLSVCVVCCSETNLNMSLM